MKRLSIAVLLFVIFSAITACGPTPSGPTKNPAPTALTMRYPDPVIVAGNMSEPVSGKIALITVSAEGRPYVQYGEVKEKTLMQIGRETGSLGLTSVNMFITDEYKRPGWAGRQGDDPYTFLWQKAEPEQDRMWLYESKPNTCHVWRDGCALTQRCVKNNTTDVEKCDYGEYSSTVMISRSDNPLKAAWITTPYGTTFRLLLLDF